jgi:hypothetical protein
MRLYRYATGLMVKAFTGLVVLASALAGTSIFSAGNPVLLASSPPALVLNLRLTSTSTQVLPPASRAALMAETQSIWNEAHIRVRWLNDKAMDDEMSLRVLVMARAVPAPGETAPWMVGELVRTEGAPPLAIASITGARRIVEAAQLPLIDLPAIHDRRLGIVLGRAVAHEIGHYLLQTSTHSTQGLMRASIDAREFADMRNHSFRLDQAAQAHLDTLAVRGTLLRESTDEQFSYSGQH